VSRTERTGVEGGIALPWSRTSRPFPRRVVQPLQAFLEQETSSAALLIAAAVVALLWANSPWSESYARLWSTHLSVSLGTAAVDLDLRHWVNDGLMSLFFLVASLEIKRELVTGELRNPRQAALPVVAAIGGMIVPALLYLLVVGADGGGGWGIAMPTDLALALGVLALSGPRTPAGMRPFLLSLAIVDDIASIVVIAVFYSGAIDWIAAGVAVALVVAIALLRRIHVVAASAYVILGLALWVALEGSGFSPTLAGVAVGLLMPATAANRPKAVSVEAHRIADETTDEPEPPDADAPQWLRLAWLSREAVSPLARAERRLHPWTSLLVLPLFALANAGIALTPATRLEAALTSRIVAGIVVARLVGKPLGILLAAALAVRLGVARLPGAMRMRHVLAVGAAAGVPFAVSLFVARLALPPVLVYRATVGVLLAAVLAGVGGVLAIRRATR
jgi:NhaA family Na+:H+ antiporter